MQFGFVQRVRLGQRNVVTLELKASDGRAALQFERLLTHPVERVWRDVVVPAELKKWFPAAACWTTEAGETFEMGGQTGSAARPAGRR